MMNAHNPPTSLPGAADDLPTSHLPLPALPTRQRMSGRDIHEEHRAASALELLFDLTTVVTVAAAAARLHHDISGGHYLEACLDLLYSFFSLWWSWVNFTWFSSAYDTDDAGYRVAAVVQMTGMLLMAVGLHQGAQGQLTGTLGYTVMRVSMVALWLRAAREHPERRATCRRYAMGLAVMQSLWLLRIAALTVLPPAWGLPSFLVLAAMEILIPGWAERAGNTPWHPHHIAERYGLLTIILLGECMVGAANAMQSVLETQGWSLNLAMVSVATVGLIAALWWTYFLVPFAQMLHQRRERVMLWGYGHAFVFAALTALAGVLEVVAEVLKAPTGHAAAIMAGTGEHAAAATTHAATIAAPHGATPVAAMAFVAGCVLAFLITLWWLGGQTTQRLERSFIFLLPPALVAAAAVAAVAYGLPLPWGLLLLIACPATLLISVTHQRLQHPERFAVR